MVTLLVLLEWFLTSLPRVRILLLSLLVKHPSLILSHFQKGLGVRSKRYALIVENGIVKEVAIDEAGVQNTVAEALLPKL